MPDPISYHTSTLLLGHLSESGLDEILKKNYAGSKIIILTDENVARSWIEYMVTGFEALSEAEIIELPAGEINKTIETCTSVWEVLSEYEVSRRDLIINLGGGAISDMGGFIASTFKRGLRFINIPTTLLAQVDASIGGKTGVDLGTFKNQVGVFANPDFVFIDPRFLATLDKEQLYSGYAEMLKHGLIADKVYWKKLLALSPENIAEILPLIKNSIDIKEFIVEQDHDEQGIRKKLNFGHTMGHALEGYFMRKTTPMLHGQAIAQGMVAEAFLSFKAGFITISELAEVKDEIQSRYGKLCLENTDFPALIDLMRNDKKNAGGKINFTLLTGIGSAIFDQQVKESDIIESFHFLCADYVNPGIPRQNGKSL